MPVVKMPDGKYVQMPDNPTPNELAQLQLMASPSAQGQGQTQGETAPNNQGALDTAAEVGKGVGRGLLGTARAFGNNLTPPSGEIAGQQIGMQPDPQLQQANQAASRFLAPDPQASLFDKGAGIGGEVGGGMLFGGGMGTGGAVAATGKLISRAAGEGNSAIQGLYNHPTTQIALQWLAQKGAQAAHIPFSYPISRAGVGLLNRLVRGAPDEIVQEVPSLYGQALGKMKNKSTLPVGLFGPATSDEQ